MSSEAYKYRAFISYNHADEWWAKWLHRRLESYRTPSRLAGKTGTHGPIAKRIGLCFRDQAELSAASHLGETLQAALRQSQVLIVICSPRSAASRWVDEEIRYFRALGGDRQVFALIVDGEPNARDPAHECFPPAFLRGEDGSALPEPLAADARHTKDGKADGFLKLAAGVLGVGFGELRQREQTRRIRLMAAVVALSLSITAITISLAISANRARNEATQRREQADDLINFMLGDLRDKLQTVGRLDVLDDVGAKALAYFATLDSADQPDASQEARALALKQIADIRRNQGQLSAALSIFDQMLQLDRELLSRHPNEPHYIYNLADAYSWSGVAAQEAGQFELAESRFRNYRVLVDQLLRLEPGKSEWLYEDTAVENNFAVLERSRGHFDAALGHIQKAVAGDLRLVQNNPGQDDYATGLATDQGFMARLLGTLGRLQEAAQHSRAVIEVDRGLLRKESKNAGRLQSLANDLCAAASLDRLRGEWAGAERLNAECGQIAQDLCRGDPGNVAAKDQVARFLSLRYELQVQRGELAAARKTLDQSVSLQQELATADPSHLAWRARYSDVLADAAEHALRFDHNAALARSLATAAVALWKDQQATPDARWYLLRSQLLLWEIASARGDATAAHASRDAASALLQQQTTARHPRQLELRARYDYLLGKAAAGDALWQDLLSMGFRSRTLTMAREQACKSIRQTQEAACDGG